MSQALLRSASRVLLAASFAVISAGAIVVTQAVKPAAVDRGRSFPLTATSLPASAQGHPYYRRGWYAWHGRYWEHRRWHAGYWGPYHRWHRGFWVYF